jgi:hypothetical protein
MLYCELLLIAYLKNEYICKICVNRVNHSKKYICKMCVNRVNLNKSTYAKCVLIVLINVNRALTMLTELACVCAYFCFGLFTRDLILELLPSLPTLKKTAL